jgi:hypothetical protein
MFYLITGYGWYIQASRLVHPPSSSPPLQLLRSTALLKPTSQSTGPIITSKQSAEATTNVRILLESHIAHKLCEKPNEYLNIHTMYSLWGQLLYLPSIRLVRRLNVATRRPLANNYQRSAWLVGGGVEGYGSREQREISLRKRR